MGSKKQGLAGGCAPALHMTRELRWCASGLGTAPSTCQDFRRDEKLYDFEAKKCGKIDVLQSVCVKLATETRKVLGWPSTGQGIHTGIPHKNSFFIMLVLSIIDSQTLKRPDLGEQVEGKHGATCRQPPNSIRRTNRTDPFLERGEKEGKRKRKRPTCPCSSFSSSRVPNKIEGPPSRLALLLHAFCEQKEKKSP